MPFKIPLLGAAMMMKCSRSSILFLLVLFTSGTDRVAAQSGLTADAAAPAAAGRRLVVITDDDFLSKQSDSWCARSLSRAVDVFRRERPGTQLVVQTRFAGAPMILRGGRPPTDPRRAILLLCDREGAVAAFCVGVPSGAQLIAMAEDADELSVLRLADSLPGVSSQDGEAEASDPLIDALHERSQGRLLRHYKPLLSKIDRETPLSVAARLLLPALAADRDERFLVAGPQDALRWRSAQQHTETMRHWCEAMLPSIVGKHVDTVWPELAAIIWDGEPWMLTERDADLISWYTQSIASGPVVLSIDTSVPLVDQPTMPAAATAARSGLAAASGEKPQAQREQLLDRLNHRVAAMAAVAALMHHRGDKAIDLLGKPEAFSGWIVLDAKGSSPTFIAERAERRLLEVLGKLIDSPRAHALR